MTREQALTVFLGALDEWGCDDNEERARLIIRFLDGGCDLSEYEDRPTFRLVNGGMAR